MQKTQIKYPRKNKDEIKQRMQNAKNLIRKEESKESKIINYEIYKDDEDCCFGGNLYDMWMRGIIS